MAQCPVVKYLIYILDCLVTEPYSLVYVNTSKNSQDVVLHKGWLCNLYK